MPRGATSTAKKAGKVVCIFPECNQRLTTQRFKKHFAKHLKEGEEYSVHHRDLYERAVTDHNLVNEFPAAAFFSVAFERLEQRLITCETLLRAIVRNPAEVLAPGARDEGVGNQSEGDGDAEDGLTAENESVASEEPTASPVPATRIRSQRQHTQEQRLARMIRNLEN